ncbi:hypothetical protein GOBAR_AA25839 [Gossypium barbadense]|uniref:Transmembrane protein n=1 Tax=Gossypium barbadense TaxID=3634 RepID=A0A2P5WUQ1_GOSBA|nr:hypothetical protein GOBAR_AA25839 [Gossypium barbadense]
MEGYRYSSPSSSPEIDFTLKETIKYRGKPLVLLTLFVVALVLIICSCRCIKRRVHGSNVDGHGNGNAPGGGKTDNKKDELMREMVKVETGRWRHIVGVKWGRGGEDTRVGKRRVV